MDNLCWLNVYPHAINSVVDTCEAAVKEFECGDANELWERSMESLKQIGNWDDITNSIILAYLSNTASMIEDKHPEWDVDYFVNCGDSHLIINHEEYYG